MKPINVKEKFTKFSKQWHPHQIATVDNMQVILAKIQGEFVWHKHDDEDELFFVQKGTMEMHYRASAPLGNREGVASSNRVININIGGEIPQSEKSRGQIKEWVEIVKEGELIVVPKGVEHCPKSHVDEEVHVLLFEKLNTKHTGNVQHEKTQTTYPKI